MGSSLLYIGISLIMFIIVFGFLFQLMPAILGAVFTVVSNVMIDMEINEEWQLVYAEVDNLSRYLITLVMTLGIVVLIIKVLMIASVHSSD